ncbi:MAG TPA: M23 family metallopeptidase, partial [Bryobacteraceae bacterium]|nr:M23 family metallopeptidase [Bryobacteraceae bacterium]
MATTICGDVLRGIVWFWAVAACAQTFEAAPAAIPQGGVVRLHGTGAATAARMNGRTVRLFPQTEGGWLGLMPVAATDAPGTARLEFVNAQGTAVRSLRIRILNARFRKQNVVASPQVAGLKASSAETDAVSAFRKTMAETRYWTEPLASPVPGCLISPFGVQRLLNGKPTGDYHGGVDLRSPAGRPVKATAAGIVRLARMFDLRGGTVALDHGQGVKSMYLHLSKFAVAEGASVQRGDVVGYAGSTGRSTAPHLHWALYVNE